ncbi:HAMP domain-containing protein [Streptomyces zhihengii]
MRGAETALAADRLAAFEQLRDDDVTALEIRIALLGGLLVITVGVLAAISRTLTRPLAVLRIGAARLADGQGAGDPVRFTGRNDEFAQVVRSLNALHGQLRELAGRVERLDSDRGDLVGSREAAAAELAAARAELGARTAELTGELERLRHTVHHTFVNLSLRTLGLVERQLGVIEKLEEREQDPERLATLFKLDHMATVMRRHSENLLVLAGTEHGQGHVGPVPLVDVLRAAVSEIERYDRVVIQSLPPHAQVAGFAADDLSHLVAELLENATSFSPPDAQVEMSGWLLESGEIMLSVQDTGIGMTPSAWTRSTPAWPTPPCTTRRAAARPRASVCGWPPCWPRATASASSSASTSRAVSRPSSSYRPRCSPRTSRGTRAVGVGGGPGARRPAARLGRRGQLQRPAPDHPARPGVPSPGPGRPGLRGGGRAVAGGGGRGAGRLAARRRSGGGRAPGRRIGRGRAAGRRSARRLASAGRPVAGRPREHGASRHGHVSCCRGRRLHRHGHVSRCGAPGPHRRARAGRADRPRVRRPLRGRGRARGARRRGRGDPRAQRRRRARHRRDRPGDVHHAAAPAARPGRRPRPFAPQGHTPTAPAPSEPAPAPGASTAEGHAADAPEAAAPAWDRITDKGLPKRTPRNVAPAAPAAGRTGTVDADALRRRLGGFQQGARDGRRDAEAEITQATHDTQPPHAPHSTQIPRSAPGAETTPAPTPAGRTEQRTARTRSTRTRRTHRTHRTHRTQKRGTQSRRHAVDCDRHIRAEQRSP